MSRSFGTAQPLASLLILAACGPGTGVDRRGDERLSPVAAMTEVDTSGFARADRPRELVFPDDHGPHPDYRLEWWYFVGNLKDDNPEESDGRRFGFQLTVFRQALVADMPPRPSAWATPQFYMGHFAVADVDGGTFHSFERTSRGAVGLAGARRKPFKVWIDDWTIESDSTELLPLRLRAASDGVALDLRLRSDKPLVLQGEEGWSRKSPQPGDASYYYSFTRMPARGSVRIGDRAWDVEGSAWLDREWSTSGLGEDQQGWDWFALQLDDGRDLMLYQLRRRDGTVEPLSHAALVGPDGTKRLLELRDFDLEVLRSWTSPRGSVYPSAWRVRIESEGLDLTVEPLLADQELDVSFRYWEGAVGVRGSEFSSQLRGRGYVELVGY